MSACRSQAPVDVIGEASAQHTSRLVVVKLGGCQKHRFASTEGWYPLLCVV